MANLIVVVFLVAVILVIGVTFLWFHLPDRQLGVTDEAGAVLVAALIVVPVADLAHEGWLRPSARCFGAIGPLFIAVSIGVGGVLLLWHPWEPVSKVNAEGLAAFAAAGAAVGGTFLAHYKASGSGNSEPGRAKSEPTTT